MGLKLRFLEMLNINSRLTGNKFKIKIVQSGRASSSRLTKTEINFFFEEAIE